MALTDSEREFIKKNYKRNSIRYLAKELGCSRSEVEKFVAELEKEKWQHVSIISKLPAGLLVCIIFITVFLTYSNSLRYDFVWDDHIQITENHLLEDASFHGISKLFQVPVGSAGQSFSYRPIQYLSLLFNRMTSGLDPFGYHFVNILIHCLVAVILFILVHCL